MRHLLIVLVALSASVASAANSILEDQVIGAIKTFVAPGRYTKFSGVGQNGSCVVDFDFNIPHDAENALMISGIFEDVILAYGDDVHYDTIFEYSLQGAQEGSGQTLHLRYQQTRTERDRREFIIDIARGADGQISSITEKVAITGVEMGRETPLDQFMTASCERLKPTD